MDFHYQGEPAWDIELHTDGGVMRLSAAATQLTIDGKNYGAPGSGGSHDEYIALYRRFAELIASGKSDVDVTPFRLMADIYLVGKHDIIAPFHE
jgi:D-galactose 1-dehydrogenase